MKKLSLAAMLLAAAAVGNANTAEAHATLQVKEAPTGSYHTATVQIGHGCGESPTISVRVALPEGTLHVRPQPKPGWDLSIIKEELAEPIDDGYGNTLTERVASVVWDGGRLLNEHFDVFAVNMRLPDGEPGSTIYFPVVQECEEGAHRWIEIPGPGESAGDYDEPAPALRLLSAE